MLFQDEWLNLKRLRVLLIVATTCICTLTTFVGNATKSPGQIKATTLQQDVSIKSLLLYEQRASRPTGDALLPISNKLVAFPHRKISVAADSDFDDDDFLSEAADIPVDPDPEVNKEIEEADRLATRPDVFDEDYVPRGSTFAVKVNNTWNDTDTMCVLARAHCGWSADPDAADMMPASDAAFVLGALLGANATAITEDSSGGSSNSTAWNDTAAEACALARKRCEVSTLEPPPPPPSVPDTWDDGPSLYRPRMSTVGWNKARWDAGEWASWVLTGPVVTLGFVGFVVYCFGRAYGALALVVCAGVDAATFYWNW